MSTETKERKFHVRTLVGNEEMSLIEWGEYPFDNAIQVITPIANLWGAAPAMLEALRNLNAYVQKALIPSVREVVGGQALLDAGWQLVAASHAAIAQAEKGDV